MSIWRGMHALDAVTELLADEPALGDAAAMSVEQELTMAAGRLAREGTVPEIPRNFMAAQVTVVWSARAQIPILAAGVLARATITAYKTITNPDLAAMFIVTIYNQMVLASLSGGAISAAGAAMAIDAVLDLEPDHNSYDGDGNLLVPEATDADADAADDTIPGPSGNKAKLYTIH